MIVFIVSQNSFHYCTEQNITIIIIEDVWRAFSLVSSVFGEVEHVQAIPKCFAIFTENATFWSSLDLR